MFQTKTCLILLINDGYVLSCYYNLYCCNFYSSTEVFCFVNLNGNMVVVGNKFFPLWRHFQKFHTIRCQAHLTKSGVLEQTITISNHKSQILYIHYEFLLKAQIRHIRYVVNQKGSLHLLQFISYQFFRILMVIKQPF